MNHEVSIFRGYASFTDATKEHHKLYWEIHSYPLKVDKLTIKKGKITYLKIDLDDKNKFYFNREWNRKPPIIGNAKLWRLYKFLLEVYN